MKVGSPSRKIRLLLGANIVLGITLILAVLLLVQDLLRFSVAPTENLSIPRERPQAASLRRDFYDYQVVLERNPFGFSGGKLKRISASPRQSPSEAPPEAPPNLLLLGTATGASNKGFAVVADSSGSQEVFKVGEFVFGMGRLQRIDRDRIVVLRKGKGVEIPLQEVNTGEQAGNPPRQEGGASSKMGVSEEDSAAAEDEGGETRILDRAMIRRAVENPHQIMTEARLLPHLGQGRLQGFVLREVKPNGIYDRLGLRNGDVLMRINDYEMTTPESVLRALSAIRETDLIEIDLLRNGSRLALSYEIR